MGDICRSRGIFLKGCVIISVSVLNKLDIAEFDEEKAIAAIKSGQAVVPFWTEIVKKQLQEGFQAFGK